MDKRQFLKAIPCNALMPGILLAATKRSESSADYDNLVGSKRSGTGAVACQVHGEKLGIVSVKDFGAVGDWNESQQTGTDNQSFFQAAIDHLDSLGGGTLHIPAGHYYLATSLTPKDNITFQGDGQSSVLHVRSNCFVWQKPNPPGTYIGSKNNVFNDFMIQGVTGATGYGFKMTNRQNVISTTMTNIRTYANIGGIHAASGSAITGLRVESCSFSYPLTGADYLIYIENSVEMNVISFVNTWFSVGTLGAIKMLTATGYAKFMDCVFESNYGQYTVDLHNPQASFECCYFGSNSRPTNGIPVDNGANFKFTYGGQTYLKISNCAFGYADKTATNYKQIFTYGGGSPTPVEISNNYFTLYNNCQVAVESSGDYPSGINVHDNAIVGATGNAIVGTDIKQYNNSGESTKRHRVKDIVISKTTNNNVTQAVWGNTRWGPWLKYPRENTTAIYEARVVARNADGTKYYANIIRSVFDIKKNQDNSITITELGSFSETPVKPADFAPLAFFAPISNNSQLAGMTFSVRGVTSTIIQWTVEISVIGSTFGG